MGQNLFDIYHLKVKNFTPSFMQLLDLSILLKNHSKLCYFKYFHKTFRILPTATWGKWKLCIRFSFMWTLPLNSLAYNFWDLFRFWNWRKFLINFLRDLVGERLYAAISPPIDIVLRIVLLYVTVPQCSKMAQMVHKLIFHLAFFCFWWTQCAFSLQKILRLVILLLNFDIFQKLEAFIRLWILAFFWKFNNKHR